MTAAKSTKPVVIFQQLSALFVASATPRDVSYLTIMIYDKATRGNEQVAGVH